MPMPWRNRWTAPSSAPSSGRGRARRHPAVPHPVAPEAAVTRTRRVVAEGVGTAFLLAAVVGSGIMGVRLSGGIDGLALLANAMATGAGLFALILAFGPISGAHF